MNKLGHDFLSQRVDVFANERFDGFLNGLLDGLRPFLLCLRATILGFTLLSPRRVRLVASYPGLHPRRVSGVRGNRGVLLVCCRSVGWLWQWAGLVFPGRAGSLPIRLFTSSWRISACAVV